jgi:signal transduction histidine kinase
MKAGRIDVQKQKDDGTGTGVMRGLLAGGRMSPAAKTIAVTIFLMGLVGFVYVRVFMAAHQTIEAACPAEGCYFSGAQYLLALRELQLKVAQHASTPSTQGKGALAVDVLRLRDVVHQRYLEFSGFNRLPSYLATNEGSDEPSKLLRRFDEALNSGVANALESEQEAGAFSREVDAIVGPTKQLVDTLKTVEVREFQRARDQHRTTVAYQGVGLALLAVFIISLYLYMQSERSKRSALSKEAEARAEAQRSAQARAALLGMVSHELRTPLQTMLANVELLSLEPQQAGTASLVKTLVQCIELISGRLDNLAQYTRLASGNVELRRERFAVADLLRRAVAEHAEAAFSNEQSLSLDLPEDVEIEVHGDPIRLHQVINNFISNAIKYSGPASIVVRARLLQHQFGDMVLADSVEISVTDTGPGIPETELESIWEPFVRGKRRPQREKGSGLGLAVVKLLATTAGWEVGVRSRPDDGTSFHVILPLSGSRIAMVR